MFRNKKGILIGLFLLIGGGLVACGGTADSVSDSDEDRMLVVAIGGDPVALDPQHANETNSAITNTQIYETLVTHDTDMNIVPRLAIEWRRIDDLTIEFDLREDVYFHNGEHFTAHDVDFTLRRAANSAIAYPILGEIDAEATEIVDDYTIRISTHRPFAPILSNLAHSTAFIVNQTSVEHYGEAYRENPVGTGPFKFENWVVGDSLTFKRNDNYWGEIPQISGIKFRIIAEQASRVIALETEEADIAMWISPSDVNRVIESDVMEFVTRDNFTVQYVGFNNQVEPFTDRRVRQAINYAVDVQSIVDTVLEGFATPAKGPMGANIPLASDNIMGYEYDPERARDLLAEAGFADGFETSIMVQSDTTMIAIATAIASQLGEVGIDVEIQPLEGGVFTDYTTEGRHEMFLLTWTTVTGDADYALYPLFHSSQHGSSGNRSFFSNDEIDDLLERSRESFDDEERADYYEKLSQVIRDEAPWLFFTVGQSLIATRHDVHGYEFRLNGQQTMHNVYFE